MSYSNGLLSDQSYQTANKYVQRGLPGVGFKLTVTGDYDMQNKKLVNVDEGENNQDVVNKHQLDVGLQTKPNKTSVLLLDGTTHMVGDLDLRGNKIILPGEIQMDRKLITNLDTDENQDLSAVNMITLKNKVEPKADKNYVDFEITKQNALINNAFVKKTGDQMNGDLILPHDSYPVGGNTNKAISYETQREIFLSRRESFPMQADMNMNNNFIQNIATPTSSHQATNKGYCDYNFLSRQKGGVLMSSLSMNQNDLFEIPAPKYGNSAANKNYVDTEITKVHQNLDLTPFLRKDGQRAMTGSLNMNGNQIIRLKEPVSSSDASTKGYTDQKIDNIQKINTTLFIKKDGSVPMAADLDMGTHKIINVGQPTTDTDAASKGYIDNTLAESHLTSSHKSNEFKYLNDPNETSSEYNITVEAFTDFNESPHKNKKAFEITLQKDVGTNDYRSRMGFNLYPLPLGTYTIIFEYYFPENTNIQLSCQSTTAYVHKQIQKDFTDYSKLLVQINNNSKTTPDYLFFTIHGTAVVSNPEGYIIVYGVKDWSDSVDSSVYDDAFYVQMFEYKNGDMQMQTDIDMNTHKIENLSDATNTKDAINKGQLDIVLNKLNELIPHIKNYRYRAIFKENFYDLTETHNFMLKSNVNNVIIQRVKPNLNIDTDLPISSFSSNGLLFNQRIRLHYSDMYSSSTPVTFFMSFIHNTQKTGTIFFSHEIVPTRPTFPTFLITPDKIIIVINRVRHEHSIPADLINKKIFIWICYHGGFSNPFSKMSIGNDQSFIQGSMNRGRTPSHTLSINYDVIVNKIGIINRFYDINSPEHHQIILEEKLNGTKLI